MLMPESTSRNTTTKYLLTIELTELQKYNRGILIFDIKFCSKIIRIWIDGV